MEMTTLDLHTSREAVTADGESCSVVLIPAFLAKATLGSVGLRLDTHQTGLTSKW